MAPFASLMPVEIGHMPVAWHQLRIPGPPPAFTLSAEEQQGKTPMARFQRRCIQSLEIPRADGCAPRASVRADPEDRFGVDLGASPGANLGARPEAGLGQEAAAHPSDRLALIDKAAPHALFDLMLSEVSPASTNHPAKADASAVTPATGRVLWQTAANFRRFVASPEIRRAFDLDGGWLQLALNCDPHTHDRESVQALKQFHLHLIYWRACELRPLQQVERLADQCDPMLMRQCLDPLSFLGSALLYERLADLDLENAGEHIGAGADNRANAGSGDRSRTGITLLPPDPAATCAGQRPLGCLLRIAHWDVLATAAFEQFIRRLHRRLAETATLLLQAFTGATQPPAPWQRHRLLPSARIAEQLGQLGLSAESHAGLLALAHGLHDLPDPVAQALRRAAPARRMHCMTLNQPCYSLTLSPMDARGHPSLSRDEPLLLSLQVKLLSGIGGAGLCSFPGIPSVRVLRSQGCFSDADWRQRADFQRRFATYNSHALRTTGTGNSAGNGMGNSPVNGPGSGSDAGVGKTELKCGPIAQLRDFATGWSP
ncbi:MAG: hypothetical protein VBE63_09760 [Lamprobacter sp.]|uniref:hypothetical protein n=1 Tax=Lamprobacter sp. TaxID=3100796 RepID=UPI002B259589|nr:hypothetical protein [Lamprobacter sp.]MEA3640215.1 hypothetical protein [Lamprobacter sp.]